MTTTQFRLNWLKKRKTNYLNTMNKAFIEIKQELILFLNTYEGEIDAYTKFLASLCQTSDPESFINILKGIIRDAKKSEGDPLAKKALIMSRVLLLKLHLMSKFTYYWTNIKIKCKHCGRANKTNFLYTTKLCEVCGSIILQ